MKTPEFKICVPEEYLDENGEEKHITNRSDIIRNIESCLETAKSILQVNIEILKPMPPDEVKENLNKVRLELIANKRSFDSAPGIGPTVGRIFPIGCIVYWPYCDSLTLEIQH